MLCLAQFLSLPQPRSDRCVLTPLGTPWRAINGQCNWAPPTARTCVAYRAPCRLRTPLPPLWTRPAAPH